MYFNAANTDGATAGYMRRLSVLYMARDDICDGTGGEEVRISITCFSITGYTENVAKK